MSEETSETVKRVMEIFQKCLRSYSTGYKSALEQFSDVLQEEMKISGDELALRGLAVAIEILQEQLRKCK